MKISISVVLTMIILGCMSFPNLALAGQTGGRRSNTSAQSKKETPFFCDRTALTPEQRKRQGELSTIMRSALLGVQELPDGYEFEFSPEPSNYQALTEFTLLERACCPFFDISIRLERDGGKLWWRLTGREGVKSFIRPEFSPWFKR
ncbi:MAG: hypothetical protein LAO21_04910 [Acidobacteriia bacterium]|nr:hypothetical protein [Terriglobia bacterium]